MVEMIKPMHVNCSIRLNIGDKICEIDYKRSGIQQGNNMTPIWFLYMMKAANETLHLQLTCSKLELRHFPPR